MLLALDGARYPIICVSGEALMRRKRSIWLLQACRCGARAVSHLTGLHQDLLVKVAGTRIVQMAEHLV
jgi:hypothetical protein